MSAQFRFGRFTLDCTRRELRCGDERIVLEPTGYRILVQLVEHRDRAVSRRELMQAVWPDVHVSMSSLYTAIYGLRSALRAADPSCSAIETLRGYGFLFADPVEVVEDGVPAGGAERARSERDRDLLETYGALTTQGIWCFELERPVSVALQDAALLEAVLQQATLSFCNAPLAATYGYAEPHELIGRRATDFLVVDRPENLEYLLSLKRTPSLRGALSFEVDRRGAPRFISNDVECVIRGGELLRVCGMQRDVTPVRGESSYGLAQRGRDLVQALLEIQQLSCAALASLARGESNDDALADLHEAHERAAHLRKTLS